MKKMLGVLFVLLVALGAAVAADRPLPKADLTIIERTEFNTLDPQRMSYIHDNRLSYAIYETLVRWDTYGDFGILPGLAQSWEVADGGVTYTFHLDPKGKWSNGDPVRASDFVFAWRRAMLPDTAADYSSLFFTIKGAEALFDWRSDQLEAYALLPERDRTAGAARELWDQTLAHANETVGMSAPDDHTLVVTLERPTAYFLDLCAFSPFNPVHPPTIERFTFLDRASGRIQQDYQWTKPRNIVCNGPYKPKSWKYKREMYLVRNPQFRDPSIGYADTIRIIPINDPNTSVLSYETGAGDWTTDVTVSYLADMLEQKKESERDNIHAFSTFGTYFWSFNCRPRLGDGRDNPFYDPAVRRAFTMAVNKQEIVDKVKRSGEKPAQVFVPRGSIKGFESPEGLHFDPVRAKQELESAGWIDRNGDGVPENAKGEPFPVVSMLYSTGSYHADIALAMGRMWKKHLGVEVSLDAKELKIYKDMLKKKDYMVARGGWFGDYGDPTTFLDLHKTGDGNNDRGYSDPKFDAMLERAANEVDAEQRLRVLEEAERYTMEETLPILPIWSYNYYYMYKPPLDKDGNPNLGGLRGISMHPRLVQYLWLLDVVDEEDVREAQRAKLAAGAEESAR
ncbi:MAG: peptide ABC transporter substrate-binding protein [Phycisphaerales bacterium]|nr:peptide ABC transporter substrate-binding protein [Phycisphaerales bacterium]